MARQSPWNPSWKVQNKWKPRTSRYCEEVFGVYEWLPWVYRPVPASCGFSTPKWKWCALLTLCLHHHPWNWLKFSWFIASIHPPIRKTREASWNAHANAKDKQLEMLISGLNQGKRVHFGQDVANNFARIFSHVEEVRPCEVVVEVVFERVVLRETPQVAVLHLDQVLNTGSANWDHFDRRTLTKA